MLKKLQDEMRQNSLKKIKENNKRIDELELQLINATFTFAPRNKFKRIG